MAPFEFSVSNLAGNIDYAPYRDGPADAGWNVTFSQQSAEGYFPGMLGNGTSSQVTTLVNASASLNYTGLAAYVFGEAQDSSWYTILCDGQASTNVTGYASGTLGCCTNPSANESHSVTLVAKTNNLLKLNGFKIVTELGAQGAGVINGTIQAAPGAQKRSMASDDTWYSAAASKYAPLLFPGSDRTSALVKRTSGFGDGTWETTGQWAIDSSLGGGGNTASIWYPRLTSNAANSVLIVTVPKNSSFVWIAGSVGDRHGAYEVQAWPDGDQSKATVWDKANASSHWTAPDQVLCFRQLDPRKSFEMSVTVLGPDPLSVFDIHSLNYVQTSDALQGNGTTGSGNGTNPTSSLSAGAIAGIVIGAVAVIAIALLAFLFIRQRKRTRQVPYLEPGIADLGDNDKFARPMPYEGETAQHNGHGASQSLYASVPVLSSDIDSSGESQQNSRHSKGGMSLSPNTTATAMPSGLAPTSTEPTASQMTSPPSSAGPADEQFIAVPVAPSSSSEPPSSAKSPRTPRQPPAPVPVRQERDAGRINAAEEVIPPQYDPGWAPGASH